MEKLPARLAGSFVCDEDKVVALIEVFGQV